MQNLKNHSSVPPTYIILVSFMYQYKRFCSNDTDHILYLLRMAAVAQNYTSNYTLFIKYNATEGYLEALERQKNDRPGKALNFIGTFQKKKKKKIAMPSSRSNIKKRVLVTLTYLESQ